MSSTRLSQQELATLEEWLASPVFKGKAMCLDKLQGFLFAVASAPDAIPQNLWLPEALGSAPQYESIGQAKEFMALLMRFYDSVVTTLNENQLPKFILNSRPDGNQQLDYQSWCEGYILGWSLSTEEWLSPGNEPLKKLTFPILFLSGAFKEEAEGRGEEYLPAEEYAKLQEECADVLPKAVVGICNFWRSKKGSTPTKRDSAKIGRNDVCPCGSNQKFKQCCGKGKTLH